MWCARCPILTKCSLSTDFLRSLQYKISLKSAQWEPHWYVRTQMDIYIYIYIYIYMTKLISAFSCFCEHTSNLNVKTWALTHHNTASTYFFLIACPFGSRHWVFDLFWFSWFKFEVWVFRETNTLLYQSLSFRSLLIPVGSQSVHLGQIYCFWHAISHDMGMCFTNTAQNLETTVSTLHGPPSHMFA